MGTRILQLAISRLLWLWFPSTKWTFPIATVSESRIKAGRDCWPQRTNHLLLIYSDNKPYLPQQLLSFAFLYAVDTFLWCRYIYNSKSYPKWVHTSLQSNKLLLCDQPQVLIKLDKAIGSVICATILISLSERNAIDVKLKPVSKIKMLPICLSITTRESFIAAMRNCVQADKLIPRLARDKWWPRRDQRKKMSLLRKIKNNCPVYPRSSKNTTPEEPLWANPDPRAAFGAYLLGTFKTCLGLPAVASTSRPRKRAYRTTTSSVC